MVKQPQMQGENKMTKAQKLLNMLNEVGPKRKKLIDDLMSLDISDSDLSDGIRDIVDQLSKFPKDDPESAIESILTNELDKSDASKLVKKMSKVLKKHKIKLDLPPGF